MPSGRTHNLITAGVAGICLAGSVLAGMPADRSLVLTSGALSGLIISPDLDVDEGNISQHVLRRSLGRLAATLWRWYWWPYAQLVDHRSWVSHAPVISTAIRLVYLLGPAWVWLSLAGVRMRFGSGFWLFAIGLALADLAHIAADRLSTEWRYDMNGAREKIKKALVTVGTLAMLVVVVMTLWLVVLLGRM